MKKLILSLLVLFVYVQQAAAQDFKLGVKAGMNFVDVKTNEELFASNNNQGYLFGLWGRIGSSKFHLQPEAYFTSKNIEFHPTVGDAASNLFSGDLKFSNIDIPILIGTRFPIGPIKARLQAGPLFSYVIDSEAKLMDNVSDTFIAEKLLHSYKDNFSAVVGGVGLDIFNFAIDLRYEHGVGNFRKAESGKQTLNVWSIGLGYSFF